MNKFAIVGCEASGKTVFMSALCDCFRAALVPENAAANRFARFATRQLRALRQWPPATPPGRAVEMNFTLRENGRALAELGLLEFGGETFRAAFRDDDSEPAHKQAVRDLLAFLGDADFILVLVSLRELLRNPGETPLDEFERDTESIWVTRGLLEFIHDQTPTANVLIGLTQADRYARELSEAGCPDRLFAARWPSIRAIAPDVPVVSIASVSGTDVDERPVEGFSTDGVLTVLREFARLQFGSPTDLLVSLSSTRTALDTAFADPKLAVSQVSAITRQMKRYVSSLNALKTIRALTKDHVSNEIDSAEKDRPDFERKLKELRARTPKRKGAHRKSTRQPRVRRVFLLALLLASVLFFADNYRPRKTVRSIPPRMRISLPLTHSIATNAVPVIATNAVPAIATNAVPAIATNAVPVIATNVVPVIATNAHPAEISDTPPFRIWHDHNGKPIEARWIGTGKDRKSITLETREGRRIRAVLYKLSEDDRRFVLRELEAGR